MSAGPIFVVGSPRSGTTMVRLLLDAHPEIAIAPESAFLFRMLDRAASLYRGLARPADVAAFIDDIRAIPSVVDWFPADLSPAELARTLPPRPTVAQVLDAVFSAYARTRGKARWGDKTPKNLHAWPSLLRHFPEARLLVVIRDGRDVALSIKRASFSGVSAWSAVRRWAVDSRVTRELLGARPDVTMVVCYEALIAQPAETCARMVAFCGLSPCPDLIDRYMRHPDDVGHTQRIVYPRPLNTERVGRWRTEGTPDFLRTCEDAGGEELAYWGYERTEHVAPLSPVERVSLWAGDRVLLARNAAYMRNPSAFARIVTRRLIHNLAG